MQRLRTRLRAGATAFPPATFALNFLTGALDSGVTFTRGTTATFVGSDGLIQTAAINAPRFDYDPVTLAAKGLLIEEQRTNLLSFGRVRQRIVDEKQRNYIGKHDCIAGWRCRCRCVYRKHRSVCVPLH